LFYTPVNVSDPMCYKSRILTAAEANCAVSFSSKPYSVHYITPLKPFHFIQMLLPTGVLPFALSLQAVLSLICKFWKPKTLFFCCKTSPQWGGGHPLPTPHHLGALIHAPTALDLGAFGASSLPYPVRKSWIRHCPLQSVFCVSGNKNGNRRTANIRSVGYSDLFVLSKEDLWESLQQYPDARRTLIEKGRQLLRKDNLLDEEVAKRQDMEQISVEQKVDALESIFENVNIRLDRLKNEFEAMQLDIDERLVGVEDNI